MDPYRVDLYSRANPDMYFLLSGKDGKDDSSGDEDEDAETKKLRGQLNSE